MKLSSVMLAAAATSFLSTAAIAAEQKSPVFGNSVAKLTSVDKNKATVGKGAYADYYGYYGYLYSYYSYYYANLGYQNKSYSSYYNAYYYSDLARTNLANAYYYQYYGY